MQGEKLCFILHIPPRTVHERNEWLEAINSAIEEWRNKKATFLPGSEVPGTQVSPPILGDSAPVWVPDYQVTMCQACTAPFTLVIRRHHCRACGCVVCSHCSDNKAPLRYKQFQPVRVCDSCYLSLEKGKLLCSWISFYHFLCSIFQ